MKRAACLIIPEIFITNPKAWETHFLPSAEWLQSILEGVVRYVTPQTSQRVTFIFTSNHRMQGYNARYRKKNKPTNVLSFPLHVPATEASLCLVGEVFLAFETIVKEARSKKRSFEHHLVHLIVHGLLHLYDFEHDTEEGARKMEACEVHILKVLHIANPYE